MPQAHHAEIADLLRARRNALRPAEVGLPEGGSRRTPGLRREEVAALASISTTYYTFLEQGRNLRPSRQVLDALARALRLTNLERAQLHALSQAEPLDSGVEVATLDPTVVRLVDRLQPWPAFVRNSRDDVLHANAAADELYGGFARAPDGVTNLLWWAFCDPRARVVYPEWEAQAKAMLAKFRLAASRRRGDPRFAELLAHLQAASGDVRRWWTRHELVDVGASSKLFRHPQLGEVRLRVVQLRVADQPDLTVVAFPPDPDDPVDMRKLLRRRP